MTFPQIVLLFVAAVVGGTLNAVAGGGSFLTFPALIFVGVPPIQANATSTVAIWPGSVASTGAYRRELSQQRRSLLYLTVGTSLIGGVVGAIIGGYGGAYYARKIDPRLVRYFVIAVGLAMTIYFFVRTYFLHIT